MATQTVSSHSPFLRFVKAIAVILMLNPGVNLFLYALRGHFNLTTNTVLLIALTVWISIKSSLWLAIFSASENFLFLNYFFTPPFHTFRIGDRNEVISLFAFFIASITASVIVNQLKTRTKKLEHRSEEGAFLSSLATAIISGHNSIDEILANALKTFGINEIAVVTKTASIPQTEVRVIYGDMEDVTWDILANGVKLNNRYSLLSNPPIIDENLKNLFTTFGSQILILLERESFEESKRQLSEIKQTDQMRSALLAAVSHDLRGPLASAKAAISTLMNDEIKWTTEDRRELLETANHSLDQLNNLIENLLDMSRLEANAISLHWRSVDIEDAIAGAVKALKGSQSRVKISIEPNLPTLTVDPILLERILVNLMENAIRFNPIGEKTEVIGISMGNSIAIKVVDHGPGIRSTDRDKVFLPFQRLGDRDNTTGVGLGLAIVKGFTALLRGTISVEDTDGGGLTMALIFPTIPFSSEKW